jgi:hypothetical protein
VTVRPAPEKEIMYKKLAIALLGISLVTAAPAMAASGTATGTLGVTATVASSIKMVFNTDASGVTLGGTGTNAATLAFGTVSAYGTIATPNVTRTATATTFTVSSPFDVNVIKANSASTNYTLTAQLASADAVNTWQVGGVTVTNASAATITATGAYTTNVPFVLALTIPFTVADATVVSNTINFTATGN